MLSVEASLRLRSATGRGEKKGMMGMYLHKHVPNTHTYAHTCADTGMSSNYIIKYAKQLLA